MEDEAWWLKSRCASLTPQEADALFFPSSGGKPQRANNYCHSCPVMNICLNNAIVNNLKGFFAGTTDEQRMLMKAWIADIVRLRMPPEPDRTERKRYLHIVVSPDTHEWLDEVEPDDNFIATIDTLELLSIPTEQVWQAGIEENIKAAV